MGAINDGLITIERMLSNLSGLPHLDQFASISQRMEHIKQMIKFLSPGAVDASLPVVICLDGPDRTGKTTQADMLAQAMRESEIPAVRLNEFEHTKSGPAIRELFMSGDTPDEVLLPLVTAARTELYSTIMPEALESGFSVVLDRGMLSSFAYGCEFIGADEAFVEYWTTGFFANPELTILFTGKPVSKTTGEKFEREPHKKVLAAFEKHADRFVTERFPSGGKALNVHVRLVKLVNERLGLKINPLRGLP